MMKLHVINVEISRDPVFSTLGGAHIMRKDFPHAEKINLGIMWFQQLGLGKNHIDDKINQNNGIWAPNTGTCELSKHTERCKLPSGSKYYRWNQRDKEMPFCWYHIPWICTSTDLLFQNKTE